LVTPQVIIPNLHWRYSGVTATNRAIAPRVARLLPAAWLGPNGPAGVDTLGLRGLMRLRLVRGPILWHARRNNEMMAGLLLKLMGWPFKLMFTSAGQRHHTWITRFLIARMDGVIATSEASASYLKRPAIVIHHGVDPVVFAPPKDRRAAFAATGLPGRYGIGCFGRVRAQKGTDLFVEAMCRLLPHYPDFTAVVVGAVDEPEFARTLKERAKEAGVDERIRFLGELPAEEVPGWYQRILIYAFTSRTEGFGLTLLEATAVGNALVAARAGAAEKVVVDGDTGLLVPPGDAAALATALESLMRDPARAAAMGARARDRAISEFSVDAEARRIADVYREILAR
jgi:mannosyltransferase